MCSYKTITRNTDIQILYLASTSLHTLYSLNRWAVAAGRVYGSDGILSDIENSCDKEYINNTVTTST